MMMCVNLIKEGVQMSAFYAPSFFHSLHCLLRTFIFQFTVKLSSCSAFFPPSRKEKFRRLCFFVLKQGEKKGKLFLIFSFLAFHEFMTFKRLLIMTGAGGEPFLLTSNFVYKRFVSLIWLKVVVLDRVNCLLERRPFQWCADKPKITERKSSSINLTSQQKSH